MSGGGVGEMTKTGTTEERDSQTDGAACKAWRCESICCVQEIKNSLVCSRLDWEFGRDMEE